MVNTVLDLKSIFSDTFVNDTISSLAPLIRVNNRPVFQNFSICSSLRFFPTLSLSLSLSLLLISSTMLSINEKSRIYSPLISLAFKSSLRTTWNYRRLDTHDKLSRKLWRFERVELIARHARHPFETGYCFWPVFGKGLS